MAVDLIIDATLRTKSHCNNKKNNKHLLPDSPLGLYTELARYLIIRLPDSEFFKICYRLLVLALAMASFLMLIRSSFIERFSYSTQKVIDYDHSSMINVDQLLSILFRDLTNEGLMKQTKQKAVFVSDNNYKEGEGSQVNVTDYYNMDLVSLNDMGKQNSLLDNTLDFVFTTNFHESSEFIERTLKTDGVVTVLLNDNPSTAFYKPSNFRITYMRRFNLMNVVAMKKTITETDDEEGKFGAARKLFGYGSEAKKATLKNLEDLLLEPPRAALGKSGVYLKHTRYLPDLMGDSLKSYPRHVFIDVQGLQEKDGGSEIDWFPKNYVLKPKEFN